MEKLPSIDTKLCSCNNCTGERIRTALALAKEAILRYEPLPSFWSEEVRAFVRNLLTDFDLDWPFAERIEFLNQITRLASQAISRPERRAEADRFLVEQVNEYIARQETHIRACLDAAAWHEDLIEKARTQFNIAADPVGESAATN